MLTVLIRRVKHRKYRSIQQLSLQKLMLKIEVLFSLYFNILNRSECSWT